MIISLPLCNSAVGQTQDTTSTIYKQEQFEMYRSLYINDPALNDTLAVNILLKSLYYGKAIGIDSSRLAAICLNLSGTLYRLPNSASQAINYGLKAIRYLPKTKFDLGMSLSAYNNLGVAYFYNSNYDSAYYYYNVGLKICEQNQNPCFSIKVNLALFYDQTGDIYRFMEINEDMISYITSLYPNYQIPDDAPWRNSIPVAFNNLINPLLTIDETDRARFYLKIFNDILDTNNFNPRYRILYKVCLAQYYSKIGESDRAIIILREIIDDDITKLDTEYEQRAVMEYAAIILNNPNMHQLYLDCIVLLDKIEKKVVLGADLSLINYYKGMLFLRIGLADSAMMHFDKSQITKDYNQAYTRKITHYLNSSTFPKSTLEESMSFYRKGMYSYKIRSFPTWGYIVGVLLIMLLVIAVTYWYATSYNKWRFGKQSSGTGSRKLT